MKLEYKIEEVIRLLVKYMSAADDLIKPTLFHSIRVGTYLYENKYSDEIILGGYLHDMLEDTELEPSEISENFGEEVLRIVEANSKSKSLKGDEGKKDLMERCVAAGKGAITVKMADILDNHKYYSRIGNEKGIQYCKRNTELLLEILPEDFDDPILEELKSRAT